VVPAVLAGLGASAAALAAAPALMPASYSWISDTTSQSAAQGLSGAWLARLGFVLLGLSVMAPGGQLGLHVQDPLAGADKLPGQEPAQSGSALDRLGPLRPVRRPRHQFLGLSGAGANPDLAQRFLAQADHHCRMRPLMRIHADHYCCHPHAPRCSPGNGDHGGHA